MNATKTISPRESPKSTRPYYHGGVVYVRTDGEAAPRAVQPADLAAEGGTVRLGAGTPIAASEAGPLEPAAVAIESDGRLRDRLATALGPPSLGPWARARLVALGLGMLPALVLLELDRELLGRGETTPGRLATDACLAGYVAFELTRRTPRAPGIAAAALVAIALRFALGIARACGHATPVVWVATALAVVAAGLVLSRAPTRERMVLELEDRLGIPRSDALAARRPPEASSRLFAASLAVAIGLPALLVVMRRGGVSIGAQAIAFVAYAVVLPLAVRRTLDPAPRPAIPPLRTLAAIGAGLALAAALISGAQHFFEAGAEIARCTNKLDAESRRMLVREAAEVAQGVARVRGSTALFAFTALAVPLAEERVYRDLLLRVLARRYGTSYGLLASAAVFGFAHVGIYEVALYQTVLLGLSFGVALMEGGIVAAFVVHAAWNVLVVT
jgi:membrane protease YdiL (CAAX protease family)